MDTYKLLRLNRIAGKPVFGALLAPDGIPFAVTLEREWLDNKPSVSCIVAGQYLCRRVQSPSKGEVFEVTNVPNRSHVLIHKGNVEADSEGCILIAEQFAVWSDGQPSVAASGAGFTELMNRTKGIDEFMLEISWTV